MLVAGIVHRIAGKRDRSACDECRARLLSLLHSRLTLPAVLLDRCLVGPSVRGATSVLLGSSTAPLEISTHMIPPPPAKDEAATHWAKMAQPDDARVLKNSGITGIVALAPSCSSQAPLTSPTQCGLGAVMDHKAKCTPAPSTLASIMSPRSCETAVSNAKRERKRSCSRERERRRFRRWRRGGNL